MCSIVALSLERKREVIHCLYKPRLQLGADSRKLQPAAMQRKTGCYILQCGEGRRPKKNKKTTVHFNELTLGPGVISVCGLCCSMQVNLDGQALAFTLSVTKSRYFIKIHSLKLKIKSPAVHKQRTRA